MLGIIDGINYDAPETLHHFMVGINNPAFSKHYIPDAGYEVVDTVVLRPVPPPPLTDDEIIARGWTDSGSWVEYVNATIRKSFWNR